MALSLEQFGKALTSSGLFTADELKTLWAAVPVESRPKTGETFARLLIEQGKLTKFQGEELLAGRATHLLMGDYVLVEELGAGGMGKVYKARHRTMQRIVALKVMSLSAMQDEAAVKRFQREVRAAAKLEHSNIVTAYDSGTAGKVSYLVMQFVDGGDLASLVRKQGVLDVERAVEYVCQAAQGLAYAHGEGVIHRDIKPANLLVDKRGVVKILDMGLARIDDGDGLTGTEQVMGTVDYMSPEQAADTKHVDVRTDVYSLGCTLWYLLTGKRMFDGDTAIKRLMKHRDQPRPSLVKARDDVSWPLEQVFHKMVAVEPQNRYASMEEVLAALEPYRPSRSNVSPTGIGSSVGMGGPRDEELSAFLKTVGPSGTKTGATVKSPASAVDAPTAMHVPAQVETDPKSEVLAPSPKSVSRAAPRSGFSKSDGPPLKLIAAGVGICAVVLLGAFVFFFSRGDDDQAILLPAGEGARRADEGASTTSLPGRPHPGPLPAGAGVKPPPGNYALRFGSSGTKPFAIPGWNYAGDVPLTIEAWITPLQSGYMAFLGNGKQGGLRLGSQSYQWEFMFQDEGFTYVHVKSNEPPIPGKRTHVAVVFDRATVFMYLDGAEQESFGSITPRNGKKYATVQEPCMIGGVQENAGARKGMLHGGCSAVIDEVRISRVVRYKKNFTPAERLEPDADTEVLYHFDEGAGETAHDASPRARHAKLETRAWVMSDDAAIPHPATIEKPAVTGETATATSDDQIALAERVVAQGGQAWFGAAGLPAEINFKTRADLNGLGKPFLTQIVCARDTEFTPPEVDVLARSFSLRHVQIDNCVWVTDDVVRKLCRNKMIRLLRIANTSATRAVVPDIAALPELHTLYCSNLDFNDDDLLRLAALTNLSGVQFDSLPITSAGIAHLAEFPKLRSLFMRSVPIGDTGLEHLAKLTDLKEMNITGSGITAAQLATLKAALPQCKFIWNNPDSEPKP